MQVKVALVPEEGSEERVEDTATMRVYDSQGIQTAGDIILNSKEGESTVTVGANGYIELENIGPPSTVDGEQMAGVPDAPEEIAQRKKEEEDEKVRNAMDNPSLDERVARARMEGLTAAQASLKASAPKAEHKDDKMDLSKSPSSSPGQMPKPPGVQSAPTSPPRK